MSNSASISAAKKRRGGAPPPMPGGGGQIMSLPPGLPPNFRQLPPQVQQQLFQQLQQRANAAAALKAAPPAVPKPPTPHPPTQQGGGVGGVGGGGNNNTVNVPGPYTVNSVIHNRAMAEVDGIHIRDLPISSAGLPCLPSGAALPPNILFKLHHDELLNMDAILNEHSNKIQILSNKFDRGENFTKGSNDGHNPVSSNPQYQPTSLTSSSSSSSYSSYDNLVNNTDFITKILDNILTNTNLSDIINQIEPIQKENEALRALLHSQQMTLNELSALVMKLVSTGLVPHSDSGSGGDVNTNDANDANGANGANGDNDENEYENDDQNHISNMEYSVYIPEETGDGANNGEHGKHGEHVEGYEETDNGSSWDS